MLILLPSSRKFDRFRNFPTCCAVVQLPMLSSHWEKNEYAYGVVKESADIGL